MFSIRSTSSLFASPTSISHSLLSPACNLISERAGVAVMVGGSLESSESPGATITLTSTGSDLSAPRALLSVTTKCSVVISPAIFPVRILISNVCVVR